MLKREWGAESNGKLPHLFIPSKTATLVTEFVVEDLPLGRTVASVPAFAVKDLLLRGALMMTMKNFFRLYLFFYIIESSVNFVSVLTCELKQTNMDTIAETRL